MLKHFLHFHPTRFSLFIILIGTTALAIAYIAEYGFGLKPCILCLYQRIPYMVMVGLGLIALILRKKPCLVWAIGILALIALLTNVGIATYHVGVESKWWTGSDDCVGGAGAASITELRAQLMNAPLVRCDEVSFRLFGLSMTAWNLIYALGACGFLAMLMRNGRRERHDCKT